MATLSPAWQPIVLPGECAPFGTPLFQPAASLEHGVLVAGGPLQLHVFHVEDKQELWYSIPARFQISGFDVHSDSLYVQDGPVLSGWNLTFGGCFGAVNLATNAKWAPAPRATATPVMLPPPPDWIYDLPDDLLALQNELEKARRVAGWAALLEEADFFHRSREINPDFVPKLSKWIGRSPLGGTKEIWMIRAALDAARVAASDLVFSAPVVRREQMQAQVLGKVYVLGQNGILHANNAMLTKPRSVAFDPPARAHLTMAEVRNAAGSADCKLFYVARDGGVRVIDGSVTPAVSLPGWNPQGDLRLDRLLPLRYAGGRLFGGGIFGTDFFAATIDPAAPLVMKMDADLSSEPTAGWVRGWWDYDVAGADQMVVLNGSFNARQISFSPGVRERKRGDAWIGNERSSFLFWNGTGKEWGEASSPLIVLRINGLGRSKPSFNLYLGNPIDSEDPAQTPHYPPAAIQLDSGSITGGEWSTLPKLAWIRCKPAVAQNVMYCVARSTTVPEYFASMLVADSPGNPTPWRRVEDAVDAAAAAITAATPQGQTPRPYPAALKEVPLPPMIGTDAVVAFSLASELASIQSAAKAGLVRLTEESKVRRFGPR